MKHTLEMKNIVKRFPGVLANDHVNLTIQRGRNSRPARRKWRRQKHPDADSLRLPCDGLRRDSDRWRSGSPRQPQGCHRARHRHGASGIHAGAADSPWWKTRCSGLREGARSASRFAASLAKNCKNLSNRHGLALDPAAEVGSLPIGVQQRVEILKLLYRDARLLILDEPTAVLTPMEKDQLFAVLRKLREDGRSVVIVTHKLNEIMEIADRVTVMRDGQVVATRAISATSGQELTRLMVGRDVNLRADKSNRKSGGAVLQIEDLARARRNRARKSSRREPRSSRRRNSRHCRRRRQRPIRTGRGHHASARNQKRPRASEWRRYHQAERRAASRRWAFPTFRPTAAMWVRSPKCPSPTMRFLACKENIRAAFFATFAKRGNPR